MVGGEQRARRSHDMHRHVGETLDFLFNSKYERVKVSAVLDEKKDRGVSSPGFYAVINDNPVHLPLNHSKYVFGERVVKVDVLKGSQIENQLKEMGIIG
jgi:hypothetical protein